jgi:prepilin signal peptidase PulO-like enzyme (type II secretory pathway)
MLVIFYFITGLLFGSFLNCLLYRIDKKISTLGRSFCPKCKKQIAWYDNIPLLSYLILRGRCRHCKKHISLVYPAIEFLTAFVFTIIGLYSLPGKVLTIWFDGISNFGFLSLNQFPTMALLSLTFLLTSCFLLLTIAIFDAKTKYVLTYYAYAAIFFAVLYNLSEYYRLSDWVDTTTLFEYYFPFVLAAIIPASVFWLASKISKEKMMGSGDADIALAIGFLVGWPNIIPTYYFAFLVGAAWGIYLLATKKAKMKSEVPFGPFLISGTFFALLFGAQLIAWYGKIFLGY